MTDKQYVPKPCMSHLVQKVHHRLYNRGILGFNTLQHHTNGPEACPGSNRGVEIKSLLCARHCKVYMKETLTFSF